jgi:hypothetical protein
MKVKEPSEIEAHLMQFTVWRFSAKARMLIEWFVTVGFAIYIHILVAQINDKIYDIWQKWVGYLDEENNLLMYETTDP